MPAPGVLESKYFRQTRPSTGASTTEVPAFSATITSGVQIGSPPAGHVTRVPTFGKDFKNLPSAGNAFMPSCPGVNRIELIEQFRQKPALNAVLDTTGASSSAALIAYTIANKDFEVLGSNMTTALVTFATGGGITLTTAGGANTTDSTILLPHLDTNQTSWTSTLWSSDRSPGFEVNLQVAAIVSGKVWAGFKLTNVDVAATDADQCYFVWDTANTLAVSTTNWVAVVGRGGVNTAVDTGIAVVAATPYHLQIQLDPNRIPYFYVNGVLVAVGDGTEIAGLTTSAGALVTNKNFIPYVGGIQKTNSVAVAVTVRELRCSRNYV